MIDWLKQNLNGRLQLAKEKYSAANKSNDTYVMTGMKFIITELETINQDINDYEEKEWKLKILTAQIKKEFSKFNLTQNQVIKLIDFLVSQNFSIGDCKHLIDIFFQDSQGNIQKKED